MSEDGVQVAADLYRAILNGWNARDATAFAAPFADDAVVVGFDGSIVVGRAVIERDMASIFADHATGRYVGIIDEVRPLARDVVLLRAESGVVPAGSDEIDPKLNAVQSLVTRRRDDGWRVALYQNTPAQFHGRPEAVEDLTERLRSALRGA